MNINIQKITLVIIKDKEGKVLASIKPGEFGLLKLHDKSQNLVITESKK